MFKLTDANNHATTFDYGSSQYASSVTWSFFTSGILDDSSLVQVTPRQTLGLPGYNQGTSTAPANPYLLGENAAYIDASNNQWLIGMDWLGYGLDVQWDDPLGDLSFTNRDTNGMPWLASDGFGERTRSFFDGLGNPTKVVAADDSFWQYSYNGFSEVTRATDPTGYSTTYSYNTKGDLTQVTDPLTGVTSYAYNPQGFVTSMTDPLTHVTSYSYNTVNLLTRTTNALNQATTFTYDTAGRLSSTTDALGFVSSYSYNALNWLLSESLPVSGTSNAVYSYTYDKVGNPTQETTPTGQTILYGYSDLNRLTSVNDPATGLTTYGYDKVGHLTGMTNALQQTMGYGYDAAGRQTSLTDALGHLTTYTYNAINQVTSVLNALNQSTSYTYTKLGQVASVTDPLGDQKLYGYNLAGDVTSVGETGPGKPTNTTTYAYDKRHVLTAVTDALGHQTSYGYDLAGNRTNVTDALGHVTSYGYDALNRVSSMTDPLSHVTSYGYDAVGNRTSVTDALGRATTYSYDGQGRVLTATDPLGGVTSYGYDLMGRPTSLTDPDKNTTSYGYDTTGRLTSMTDPLGHPTTYAYNVLGQVTSTMDRDGRQRTFAYDPAGRETSETWLNGLGQSIYTATYTYDAIGELTNASDPYSVYSCTYDSADRLTSVDNNGTSGVPHVVLSYGYDVYNNRTSLTDSLGGSVSYSYDAAHRLTGLALTVGTATASVTMAYDNADRLTGLTRTAGAGTDTITSSFSYDNADRLTNITHTDVTKLVTLASYTYGYDNANQLTSYQDTNSSLTYGYDRDGQLTSVSGTLNGSSYSAGYSYDANGNRTMTGYKTGTGNELTSDGTYNYGYDSEGNMTSQTNIATSYVTYYTWDYRNRLTEVKQEDNHGTVLNDEKFTYDVFNNRIGVSLNGTPQLYTVYDGANPYMDFNGSGTLTERYLTDPRGLNHFYAQMSAGGTTQWLLTDNLDSVRQVIDTSGNLLDRITYDAFGQIVAQTNSANAPRFGYAGGALDTLTGNVQFYARPYSPGDGRFESEDPKGFAARDANLFRYVFNAATKLTDRTGMDIWKRMMGDTSADTNGQSFQTNIFGAIPNTGSAGGVNIVDQLDAQMMRGGGAPLTAGSAPLYGTYWDGRGHTAQQALSMSAPYVEAGAYIVAGSWMTGPSALMAPLHSVAALPAEAALSSAAFNTVVNVAGGADSATIAQGFGRSYYGGAEAGSQLALGGLFGEMSAAGGLSFAGRAQMMGAIEQGVSKLGALEAGGALTELGPLVGREGLLVNCFPPDTLVGTESGLRPIGRIGAGERVWGYDFQDGVWRLCEVECRHDANYDGPLVTLYADMGKVTATAYHPFWVIQGDDLVNRPTPRHLEPTEDQGSSLPGRWVNSHDLREGDVVFLKGCGPTTVRRVVQRHQQTPVCNLTVQGLHTFAVGEAQVLVHNSSGTGGVDPLSLNIVGSTQPELSDSIIQAMRQQLRNDPAAFWKQALSQDGPIEIWEINGRRYLFNGNHRWHAAVEEGVTIPPENIRIIDKTGSQIPTFLLNQMQRLP